MLAHYEGTGQALVEAIAARTGTDLEQDMYPRILAGAVIAVAQVAVRRWSAADPPVPLGPLLLASARAARDGLLGVPDGG